MFNILFFRKPRFSFKKNTEIVHSPLDSRFRLYFRLPYAYKLNFLYKNFLQIRFDYFERCPAAAASVAVFAVYIFFQIFGGIFALVTSILTEFLIQIVFFVIASGRKRIIHQQVNILCATI